MTGKGTSARGDDMKVTRHLRTRRTVIGGIGAGMAGAALAATTTSLQAQATPKTFVLVHGSSADGWCAHCSGPAPA